MWKKEHKSWNAASPGVSKKRLVRWRRRRRSNQGFGGVRFSASLERGTGERNGFLFLSPSREICACERVYSSLLVDERWCSARAWRERRQCTFPAESFRRESSAHHAREWVRSFPSVECCSTGSISATIPEAPRLLLLNGYSCFWKDPLPYENERCNKWWIKTRHLLSFYFGFGKCLAFWDTKVMKLNTHYIYRDEVLYICFVSQVKIWIFFKDKELSCEENYAPLEKSIKYRYIYVNVLWLV